MRDLDIGRRLPTAAVTPEEVRSLGDRSLPWRAPYFAGLIALVDHADPALRAAALHALAGARGVPGLRAMVARLDDEVAAVREAAVAALRTTARDAAMRFAHALFHPRVDVRRAALADLPTRTEDMALHLRADPACADLAARIPWQRTAVRLALDLHAAGRLPHGELGELLWQFPPADLATLVAGEHGRPPTEVEAYLGEVARAPAWFRAPGADVIDQIIEAVDCEPHARWFDHVIQAFSPRRKRALTRRAVAALVSRLAHAPSPAVLAMCVALEPRVIEHAGFSAEHAAAPAAAATRGLVRFAWPVRPTAAQVMRILERPIVRADLALAAAVVGLLPGKRLATLAKLLGDAAIVEALRTSDHGWDEICRLPVEAPAREIGWLQRLERSADRYVALAARALGIFGGKRLAALVDQLPRTRRAAVFLRFAAAGHDAATLEAVCKAIAERVDRAGVTDILAMLLGAGGGERGPRVAAALARVLPAAMLGAAVAPLADDAAVRLVAVIDADPLPRDRELAVAEELASRADPVVQAWSQRMRNIGAPPPPPLPPVVVERRLSAAETARIATCTDAELASALAPALAATVTGLAGALAQRAAAPSVPACAALIGCGDPLDEVARQLDRFAGTAERFDDELDGACVAAWNQRDALPPLGHARLYRWERHARALTRWTEQMGGPHAALSHASQLPGRLAGRTLWAGIAEVVVFARYRVPDWLIRHGTVALAVFAAGQIDREFGRAAARIVVALVESNRVPAAAVLAELLDRAGDADAETRSFVARIARLDGMPAPPPVVDRSVPERSLIEQIQTTGDLDQLIAWCGDARPAVVQEAALALVLLGAPGQRRLADLLARVADLPAPVPVLASIALWDCAEALAVARGIAAAQLPPEWQFQLCLGLGDGAGAIAAVRAEAHGWFRRNDWERLIALAGELACALACADAPHHHAYQRALAILFASDDARVPEALCRFLEVDDDRPIHLRRSVARRLLERHGDARGLPVLIEEIVDDATGVEQLGELAPGLTAIIVDAVVSAALIGGHAACSEKRMWAIVQRAFDYRMLDAAACGQIAARVLEQASTAPARRAAAQLAISATTAGGRLTEVAEVFAWGIRRGVELTGRMFRIHLTSAEREFGHTRLDESRIFVSPLPLLRREPHGRDIVEGLVLHELGHHRYHRGELAQKLWKRAHDEGIGHLLNLIADEHLERNLRAVDSTYGDRLKRLGAYAFQHAAQDVPVSRLLACLRGSAARALCATTLEVAFDESSVRIERGAVLAELERAGHPLARFARAFRMGLGNRFADPLVAIALDMCARVRTEPSAPAASLRSLDMQGLYDLTRRIAQLFGGAAALAQVFGGPEDLRPSQRDGDVFGAGIDDDILQREVERILDPRRSQPGDPRRPPRLQINVAADDDFARITRIERVPGNAERHRQLAAGVTRHATRLRAHLDDLGLRYIPERARLRGHMVDRTRLEALVTRRDPRILVARTPVRRTDLFLGTLVDCSGSMQAGDNIDRARRFAVLVAEAVRPLTGVEARFFGFTDSLIYDAGDARDCGVSSLEAGGGNNDAGALLHAANVALASRRRARVLVMISDGLPTECSVAALRGLVTQLTRRRGIVCAQVAVRKLEEECFPHHVVLDDAQIDVAVARFGRMIGDLTRRALGSA